MLDPDRLDKLLKTEMRTKFMKRTLNENFLCLGCKKMSPLTFINIEYHKECCFIVMYY